ncbi:uncharacterized protein LOC142331816 [Lycorma delicatula]|uniref:uncharacterized protein LOC142331816 n=1 Tax=Lycorma delicatula TaxID=130591 RepID=UPI003F512357
MPVHQISVSPMGANNINNSNINANGVNSKQQNRNSGINSSAVTSIPAVISCSGTTGIGEGGGYDSQTSSLSSNGYDICRICHCEGDSDVPLIAPCYCAGSLRYVHQVCLQQWIKSSNIRRCELCKFQFIMQSKTKPFSEWEHLEMSGFERRKLFCAVMFHAVALICVVWSLYVLIDRTAEEIQKGILEWPFWTKLIVVTVGFTGGVVFMYIQCKAYLQICQRWKAFNRVIYVQNAPEKPSLSPLHSSERLHNHKVVAIHSSLPTAGVSSADNNRLTIEPSSSEFKPYQDGVRESSHSCGDRNTERDETSIDLKGIRNLHIFFNDENRIHVQKDKSPSCKIDCLEDGDIINNSNEYNSVVNTINNNSNNGCNNGQLCPSDNHGSMSWHIKIGKTTSSSSDRSDNIDRNVDMKLPDLNQMPDENIIPRNNNSSNNLESPVLKLQIKKAEIVIKFGQKAPSSSASSSNSVVQAQTSSALSNVTLNDTSIVTSDENIVKPVSYEENNQSSVNIKFDNRETDNSDPIVIDLVQNQPNTMTMMEQHAENNSSSSSSNPVQIRLDFGRKEINPNESTRSNNSSEITLNEDSVKLLTSSSYSNRPLSDRPYCSRTMNNNTNNEKNGSKSEPGSGCQSPLLKSRKDHNK